MLVTAMPYIPGRKVKELLAEVSCEVCREDAGAAMRSATEELEKQARQVNAHAVLVLETDLIKSNGHWCVVASGTAVRLNKPFEPSGERMLIEA